MKKTILTLTVMMIALLSYCQQSTIDIHVDISSLSGTDTTIEFTSEDAAYVWSIHGYVIGCDSDSSEIKTYYSSFGKSHKVETGSNYSTLIANDDAEMLYDDILISKELILVFDKNDATTGHFYGKLQKNFLPVFQIPNP